MKIISSMALAILLFIGLSGVADAEGAESEEKKEEKSDDKARTGDVIGEDSLLSNFSVGLGVFHLPNREIKKAEVVNGVVRVTDEQEVRIGPWLQTTYVWDGLGTTWTHPGFFLGVEVAGGDGLFRTFGAGVQLSFRRSKWDETKNHSVVSRNLINVGLGVYVSKIQVLADGISENNALPDTYESVVLREKTVYGPMLSISFSLD